MTAPPALRIVADSAEDAKREAARQRAKQYRQRRREGRVVLRADIGADLIIWLADHGWIGERDRLDRKALEEAISDVLDCLASKKLIANLDAQSVTHDAPSPVCGDAKDSER